VQKKILIFIFLPILQARKMPPPQAPELIAGKRITAQRRERGVGADMVSNHNHCSLFYFRSTLALIAPYR
jgi:hypothetical protein